MFSLEIGKLEIYYNIKRKLIIAVIFIQRILVKNLFTVKNRKVNIREAKD